MAERKAIGKTKRFEVFKRDGFVCVYCGAFPPKVVLEVDHIDPVSNGGKNHIDNLVTACFNCNRGKRDRLLSDVPQSLAEKAKRIKEVEEQLAGYRQVINAKLDREDQDMWDIANTIFPGCGESGCKKTYLQSIKMFLGRLEYFDVLDAANRSSLKECRNDDHQFRYFAAICWAYIKDENGAR